MSSVPPPIHPPTSTPMPTWLKVLIGVAILAGVTVTIASATLVFFINNAPDTFVYTGPQMSKAHLAIVRELGLLGEEEEIQYFYSDGFFDIRDGMYFVTDERLVLYSESWEDPLLAVTFDEIVDAEVEYDDSFFNDSTISILLDNGDEWSFPVSSERGRDEDFFEYLDERIVRTPNDVGVGEEH